MLLNQDHNLNSKILKDSLCIQKYFVVPTAKNQWKKKIDLDIALLKLKEMTEITASSK